MDVEILTQIPPAAPIRRPEGPLIGILWKASYKNM
jgi:hypothetical protein